ncbi:hypothetical protein [Motilimonas eburnea]|uniref:hypothetical protein n=1 Tax=Motilimonas eburnea TaxID=1737488 RepID=UPI001E50F6ED|nr:hypothetical protein [Motilimonas eburnea]
MKVMTLLLAVLLAQPVLANEYRDYKQQTRVLLKEKKLEQAAELGWQANKVAKSQFKKAGSGWDPFKLGDVEDSYLMLNRIYFSQKDFIQLEQVYADAVEFYAQLENQAKDQDQYVFYMSYTNHLASLASVSVKNDSGELNRINTLVKKAYLEEKKYYELYPDNARESLTRTMLRFVEVYMDLGHRNQALKYLSLAGEHLKRMGEQYFWKDLYIATGKHFFELNEYEKVIDYYGSLVEQGTARKQWRANSELAEIMLITGQSHYELGRPNKDKSHFAQAKKHFDVVLRIEEKMKKSQSPEPWGLEAREGLKRLEL